MLDQYIPNGEWEIMDSRTIRSLERFTNGQDYVILTFYITIRRKTLYHMFNLMLPCICISVLAFFTFYLPPESDEKITLSITTLLSLTLFLNRIADYTLTQSDVLPLVSKLIKI